MNQKIEDDIQKADDHILVCLSAAPSNLKIIDTAAKMVNALQARFTALYVQTGTKAEAMDKEKLGEHIRYAETLGAEIVMTHGENVPVQIAEYARLSGVTIIVIGQSNARRNHFFSKSTLTEKLIEIIPDIDIHIVQDAVKNRTYSKRSFTELAEKPSVKDYVLTAFIFVVCTLIGLLFQKLDFTDTNIVTIYIFGVLITSIVTDGYFCSIAGSFLSVFLFCFFLTEPRMSFQTYAVGYPVTFLIMLISSVLTGTLAAKLKTHAKLSAQLAFRTQILFDTDRLLQREKGETEILGVTCTQLIRLLNRNITAYIVKNGTLSEGKLFSGEKENSDDFLTQEEQDVARWTYENRQRAGVSTHHFPQAKCLYLAIRSGNNVYGVIGIPMQKETLDSYEYSILLSVINGCALAMENAQNAMEKEKNAILAKNEQLRADLLRAISHDLRTPLTSIIGSSDSFIENYQNLTDPEKQSLVSSINEDSHWLLNMVENLLSVTRIDGAKVEVVKTPTVLDELIDSVLMKFSKKHPNQNVITQIPEEFVDIPMDSLLIEQVLLNLLENAVFHAKGMTELMLSVSLVGDKAVFEVADNGCGIPEDALQKIFSGSYEKSAAPVDGTRSNMGIGLSVCVAIVKAHGSDITAENRKGGGAVFRFALERGGEDDGQ